jgi:hypothetical protein
MTRDEYNVLFHRLELNLVAFKRLMDCDEEVLSLVNHAIKAEREASIDAVLQIIKELRPALVLTAFADKDNAWVLDKVKESIEKLKGLTKLFMDSYDHGVEDTKQSAIEGIQKAILLEREECAKVCDEMEEKAEEHGTECCKWPTPSDCAFAIRARGNT